MAPPPNQPFRPWPVEAKRRVFRAGATLDPAPSLMTGPKVRAAHRERSSAAKGRTNLWNKGLTSADRSNKATLPLTVPRSHSSRLQRIHPRACNNYDSRPNRQGLSARSAEAAQCGTRAKLYLNTSLMCGTYVVASGTDSGLEAFSHNPADDSFAPLPDRTGANTKYLNELFLSY